MRGSQRTTSPDGRIMAPNHTNQSSLWPKQLDDASSTYSAFDAASSGSKQLPAAASRSPARFGQPKSVGIETFTQREDYAEIRLPTRQNTDEATENNFWWCAGQHKGSVKTEVAAKC